MDNVNDALRRYWAESFAEHGATARAVGGRNEESLAFHCDKILAVIEPDRDVVSILDIGCGYGGLLDRAIERGIEIDYTGIDLVAEMVSYGRSKHKGAVFAEADIFTFSPGRMFDYVVANGVFYKKLDVSLREFGQLSRRMIKRMFDLANRGIAFNMLTSYVNFTAPDLYYQNPGELISFCVNELSTRWRLDHVCRRYYDFTMYVYKDGPHFNENLQGSP